ncbi:hypothetical protein C8J56DRAFT_881907 [Mycena floridula]|nr:hypothetical protein C8J56DRAFT_881907 [Mycena floridula]
MDTSTQLQADGRRTKMILPDTHQKNLEVGSWGVSGGPYGCLITDPEILVRVGMLGAAMAIVRSGGAEVLSGRDGDVGDFFASSEEAERDGEQGQIGVATVGALDGGGARSVVHHLSAKYMNISKQMLRKGTKGSSKGHPRVSQGPFRPWMPMEIPTGAGYLRYPGFRLADVDENPVIPRDEFQNLNTHRYSLHHPTVTSNFIGIVHEIRKDDLKGDEKCICIVGESPPNFRRVIPATAPDSSFEGDFESSGTPDVLAWQE